MLRRLSWVTTVVIGFQMVLGGIIVGKDAGFACPNWPLCGKAGLPPLTGSLILELVHRFSALLVTVLVLWVFILIWRHHRDHREMFRTSVLAVISLLLQVIVGGLIVLFMLPGVVTTIDVVNSMALLGLFVHISNLLEHDQRLQLGVVRREPDPGSQSLVVPSWILCATVMVAVLAGAVFRHTGASQALFGQDSYIASHDQHTPPSMVLSQSLLMLHICTGVLAAIGSLWFAMAAYRAKKHMGAAIASVALVAVQAVLGVASLATALQFTIVTLHWSTAGLIVAVMAWIVSEVHIAPSFQTSTEEEDSRTSIGVPDTGTVH